MKRFSQERFGRKLTTQVDFPTEGLDLTEFAAEGVSGGKILYDLYAVSNHSGGTSSGHYTAYCKNPYSNEWHYFNDSRRVKFFLSLINILSGISTPCFCTPTKINKHRLFSFCIIYTFLCHMF